MQCEEWDDENSELFKESHDEAVHKNSYKSRLYELISASLVHQLTNQNLKSFGIIMNLVSFSISSYRIHA